MRLAGEPDGGEAEAEQARDAPRAVAVRARSDLVPVISDAFNPLFVIWGISCWGFGSAVHARVEISQRWIKALSNLL